MSADKAKIPANDVKSADEIMQDRIRARANYSMAVLEKHIYGRSGYYLVLHPGKPKGPAPR